MSKRVVCETDSENSPEGAKRGETYDLAGKVRKRDVESENERDTSSLKDKTDADDQNLYELGESHRERFKQLGGLDDIEKAIEYGGRALALTPGNHPDLLYRHAGLGESHTYRFRRLGEQIDLDKAIKHISCSLALTFEGDANLFHRHSNLGGFYIDRFRRLGELDDLNKAIEHKSSALALAPEGDLHLPYWHANVGIPYISRFRRLGKLGDLEQAIKHFLCALKLTPKNDPSLSRRHAFLGESYTDRFRRLGEVCDLEKGFEHFSLALALTPKGHPDLPDRHASLGVFCGVRFGRLGEPGDLDKAIDHECRALELTPEDHPDLAFRHACLGVSYINRFRRLGELNDLEKSIEHGSLSLAFNLKGHPELSARHANLGISYCERFRRLGELGDLEKGIDNFSRALKLTPEGHPQLSTQQANLGGSYGDRFLRLGELADLEKAIKHESRALELVPSDHPDLPHRHSSLGGSYSERFRRLGEPGDSEKAIQHHSQALALTAKGHPDLSLRHTNLGMSYGDRYQRLGKIDDLEKALEHKTRALELTPQSHPDLAYRHTTLGVSYTDRFRLLGETNDLEKATEHSSRGLSLSPDGHPELPLRRFNKAIAFFHQYQHSGNPSHLNDALTSFRESSQPPTGSPRYKFNNALSWAKLASTHSFLNSIEAYGTAIDLLPQFIWLGATTRQRYYDLSTAESLAVDAARTAILHSDHKLALEWLEHARCVVWNQTIMLRSPVDELQLSYPDMAGRLQAVSQHLHSDSSEPSIGQSFSSSVSFDNDSQSRYHLAREYDGLISEIRSLPGQEEFLLPMKADRLILAAKIGPIAVINCHPDQCDALLILPGQTHVMHLPLPRFTEGKARSARSELHSALRAKGLRERGFKILEGPESRRDIGRVLASLWHNIVKPVLDFLGYTDHGSLSSPPHITWCPTGALSFLPLHAAGDYDQPGARVFDYVISSYTPTLTALLASPSTSLDSTSRVLLVGQAHTPGRSPLPGTTEELELVKTQIHNRAEYSQLVNEQATTTKVLNAMEHHDWVHLACHAHQNINDPTKSGFHLHDGTLDLASINRRSFKNKGLAFLSACQTATGDESLPDEAIHLASGMLMAGYPSVIATMWSVIDSDAPLVADKVYAELMKEGKTGNGEVGKALHDAVAALREEVGEKEFVRWVPYIHIGL